MNTARIAATAVLLLSASIASAQSKPLRVYISVDLEGIDGVVHSDQTSTQGSEFARARKLMMEEVNSAIDGAMAAGATEILVNDSHGTHRNLFIEDLRPPARLVSSSIKPYGMMQGLDPSYAAVIFIGYHARAGSPVGVIAHTGTDAIADLKITGTRVGESGMNTLYAASLGVPVVMLTGDNIAVAQARELTPDIEAVEVKEAIGTRSAVFRPLQEVRAEIRATAEHAIRNLAAHHAVPLKAPFTFEVTFHNTTIADIAEAIPTVKRVGPATVTYVADDFRAGYRLLRLLYAYLSA
jgi:D-amino peptidase